MNDFMSEGKYYIGANYWASHASINMWTEWSAEAVEEDFKRLSSHGIRYLRMFLFWPAFQPLKGIMANETLYEYRMMPGEKPLPDTEAGRAGVSEEACEHFEEFCRLADKYDMKLIVGLLTGHMSFRFYSPEAFERKNFLSDPTVIKWEIRFVRYFVNRFKHEKAIVAWDLGNECSAMKNGIEADQSYVWTACIAGAIRESDTEHPIVSGLAEYPLDHECFNVRDHAELVDVLTTHPYQIFSPTQLDPVDSVRAEIEGAFRAAVYQDLGGKPAFVEETGSIGYMNCSEKTEAAALRTALFSTWAEGRHGLFWWCAFDQGHFDYAPYDWNNYGSEYGFFKADGSAKPVAKEAKAFDEFLKEFPYAELPAHKTDAVCVIPRQYKHARAVLETTFILAKQAGFDLRFAHAEDKIPDAPLYLMPSVDNNQPIFLHRLNELLEKVRNGASLYLSMGDTLFRRIPELTGLTIASRQASGSGYPILDETVYPFEGKWKYHIEAVADTCEVLAASEDGMPMFVCNRYGKGKIFFLSQPMEELLSVKSGVFHRDAPYYAAFYEKLAKELPERIVRSGHPLVLCTEHQISSDRVLTVAINYGNQEAEVSFAIKSGWRCEKVYRGSFEHEKIRIPANNAVILELCLS